MLDVAWKQSVCGLERRSLGPREIGRIFAAGACLCVLLFDRTKETGGHATDIYFAGAYPSLFFSFFFFSS